VNPKFFSNLEAAHWLESGPGLLSLSGWVLACDGSPVQAIRLRSAERSVDGYYGIPRPDVARAHPDLQQGPYAGFSFLTRMADRELPGLLEVQDASDHWHLLTTIVAAAVSCKDLPAPLATELENPRATSTELGSVALGDRPVLFISHDFAAAGAQMLLLRLMRWLRANRDVELEILVARPRGACAQASAAEQRVLSGFSEMGPVHFLSDLTRAPENLGRIRRGEYRLVYANTGTLGWLLPSLRPFHCPVVSHVHELAFWLEKRTGLEVLARQVACTDRFIACSTSVRDYLAGRPAVPPEAIDVIHDCGSAVMSLQARQLHSREDIRRELDIADGAFVVVACGTFDWRKGADLFVPLCVALRRKLGGRDFRALWIGDFGPDLVRAQFVHEVHVAGLTGKVSLLGQQKEPWRWMLAADAFALPSREDPFPIVMLEAGAFGLPVVGFENSGGVTEFVGRDAGLVVPYLDVEAFADALHRLAANPGLARTLGQVARERATGIYDETISFSRIADVMGELSVAPVPAVGR
jgi:glycosyltransferase involved in cell wall biosynthesis